MWLDTIIFKTGVLIVEGLDLENLRCAIAERRCAH